MILSREQAEKAIKELSTRERQMVSFLIEAYPIRDIAKVLKLSIKTVHTYRSRIHKKFRLHNDVSIAYIIGKYDLEEVLKEDKVKNPIAKRYKALDTLYMDLSGNLIKEKSYKNIGYANFNVVKVENGKIKSVAITHAGG